MVTSNTIGRAQWTSATGQMKVSLTTASQTPYLSAPLTNFGGGTSMYGTPIIYNAAFPTVKPRKQRKPMTLGEKRELAQRRNRAAQLLEKETRLCHTILRGGPSAGRMMVLPFQQTTIVVAINNPVSFAADIDDLSALTSTTAHYYRTNEVDAHLNRIFKYDRPKKSKR